MTLQETKALLEEQEVKMQMEVEARLEALEVKLEEKVGGVGSVKTVRWASGGDVRLPGPLDAGGLPDLIRRVPDQLPQCRG